MGCSRSQGRPPGGRSWSSACWPSREPTASTAMRCTTSSPASTRRWVRRPATADTTALRGVGRPARGRRLPLSGCCRRSRWGSSSSSSRSSRRDLGGSRRAQVLAAVTAALSVYLGVGASRHDDRPRPAGLGAHPVAAREAPCWRRPASLAGRGGRGRDRAREQGHRPLPGRRACCRARPRPPLGRRPLAVGMVRHRDRPPALDAQPRLAGGERLAAAGDGPGDRGVRGRQPRPLVPTAVALPRAAAVSGERRRSCLDARSEGGRAVACDRDRRASSPSHSSGSPAARPTTRSAARACSWPPGGSSSTVGWLAGHRTAEAGELRGCCGDSREYLSYYLTLPILPSRPTRRPRFPRRSPTPPNEIGWPEFVATVEGVVAALPADRARPRRDPDERLQRGKSARASGSRAATGLLGPQLATGPGDRRPPTEPSSSTSATGDPSRLEPVLHGCQRRRPHRQRARDPRTASRAGPSPCVLVSVGHGRHVG